MKHHQQRTEQVNKITKRIIEVTKELQELTTELNNLTIHQAQEELQYNSDIEDITITTEGTDTPLIFDKNNKQITIGSLVRATTKGKSGYPSGIVTKIHQDKHHYQIHFAETWRLSKNIIVLK